MNIENSNSTIAQRNQGGLWKVAQKNRIQRKIQDNLEGH